MSNEEIVYWTGMKTSGIVVGNYAENEGSGLKKLNADDMAVEEVVLLRDTSSHPFTLGIIRTGRGLYGHLRRRLRSCLQQLSLAENVLAQGACK